MLRNFCILGFAARFQMKRMKSFKKIYHFFSALTLVLFLSSMVLPTALSAASLLCGMDMSVANTGTLSCAIHGADQSEVAVSLDKATCNFQQICEQAVTDSQPSVEAGPQIVQNFTAVLAIQDIAPGILDYSKLTVSQSEPISPEATPPIFLLNSAFLN